LEYLFCKDNTGTISLTAGVKYDIVLEYYENVGQAVSKLYWNSTSQAKEIIPQSQLFQVAVLLLQQMWLIMRSQLNLR
jgi:hypothetical protein